MGRLSQRAPLLLTALHRHAPARLLSPSAQQQPPGPQGLPRVLRPPAYPAPRARGRDGGAADGDGDRVRLPQVPEGEGERAAEGLTASKLPLPLRDEPATSSRRMGGAQRHLRKEPFVSALLKRLDAHQPAL